MFGVGVGENSSGQDSGAGDFEPVRQLAETAKCGTKDFAKELALVLRGHFGLEAVSQGQEG